MEIWKDIKGYEGMYQVSNLGRVKSLERLTFFKNGRKPRLEKEMIKRPALDGKGYNRMCLRKHDIPNTFKLHRLVAEHFIPNPDNKPQVNHINGDKLDNRVENLEWMTNDENMHHSKINKLRIGKMPSAENHSNSKLTNEQVRYIRSVYKKSSREFGGGALAKQFNMSIPSIIKIIHKKTYTNVL